jgi:hypothetical protein
VVSLSDGKYLSVKETCREIRDAIKEEMKRLQQIEKDLYSR